MRAPEEVYALFVEANPIPDPDLLMTDLAAHGAGLYVVGIDEGGGDADVTTTRVDHRRDAPGRRPAAIAAALVLVVAALGYAAMRLLPSEDRLVGAGDAAMHVVFDGEVCTYTGPLHVAAGEASVSASRLAAAEPVTIAVVRIDDDSITLAEIEAWAAEHSAEQVPPFVEIVPESYWVRGALITLDEVTEDSLRVVLEPGRYVVTCNTAPEGTDRAFPAAILEVVEP